MSQRKNVVETYFDGFRKSDHAQILACLTDDVAWDLPGYRHLIGKSAFDREISNQAGVGEADAARAAGGVGGRPGFTGSPTLVVDRLIEEGDSVVAIGEGWATQASGAEFHFAYCDVFTFTGDLIHRVESYLVPLVDPS
jgi:ketosteroid isomerase-like protein